MTAVIVRRFLTSVAGRPTQAAGNDQEAHMVVETEREPATRRRRTGSRTAERRAALRTERRGRRRSAEEALSELEPMVAALIARNRELHAKLDKLSRQPVGPSSATVM